MQPSSPQHEKKQPAETPPNQTFSFELFEKLGKSSLLFVALVYGSGLIVTNVYLAGLGVSDFSSLRPKYILTGTWTILLTIAAVLPVLVPTLQWIKRQKASASPERILTVLFQTFAGGLGGIILYGMLSTSLTNGVLWHPHFSWIALFALIVLNIYACLVTIIIGQPEIRFPHPIYYLFYGMITLILVVSWARDLVGPIYAEIPEGLGGGKPIQAELILNTNGLIFWKQTIASSPEKSSSTGTIQILYQNEHEFVVRVPTNGAQIKDKIVILNKSLVDGEIILK